MACVCLFCVCQDLETAALTEAETWREQQQELQDQQAQQVRARQEQEAEVERFKQVRDTADEAMFTLVS